MGNGDSLLRYTVSGTLRRESPLPTATLAASAGPEHAPPFASSCFDGLLLPIFLPPAQRAQQGAVTESTYL